MLFVRLPPHHSQLRKVLTRVAPRPRPRLSTLIYGALPVGQHLAVIALFLAVFDGLLEGNIGPGEVDCACLGLGLAGYGVRRWGWGITQSTTEPRTSMFFLYIHK
jgi:hypothetical protein